MFLTRMLVSRGLEGGGGIVEADIIHWGPFVFQFVIVGFGTRIVKTGLKLRFLGLNSKL